MCVKIRKIAMISGDYHDIRQLLFLTIIVSSKNCTISIIVKENITVNGQRNIIIVNRQNQLIAHPYTFTRVCMCMLQKYFVLKDDFFHLPHTQI